MVFERLREHQLELKLKIAWSTGAQLIIFFCFRFSVVFFEDQGSPSVLQHIVSVESSSLLLHSSLT